VKGFTPLTLATVATSEKITARQDQARHHSVSSRILYR
jgi:hypothetical protein